MDIPSFLTPAFPGLLTVFNKEDLKSPFPSRQACQDTEKPKMIAWIILLRIGICFSGTAIAFLNRN